ncbi:MAG: 30S ribosome-binding factor RbfA [Pseudomonadota bacterium]
MPREFSRTERVNQQLHREIATILQHDFKHRYPDIGMVTVSGVEVSRDLSHAKVFVSFLLEDTEKNKSDFNLLKQGASFVRSILAKKIKMRAVPSIHFMQDNSATVGSKISALVDHAIQTDKQKHKSSDG